MTRLEFLETLRRRLAGLPKAEIDDLVADYATHFADGMAAGRSEAEIAEALGDPMRLARELRAEAGFRRWETERTPASFFAVLFGFVALVAVDFVFLLPLLGGLVLFTLIAELMGKHSNLILLNPTGAIVDSAKRITHRINRLRETLPGRPYQPPPEQTDRIDPFAPETVAR